MLRGGYRRCQEQKAQVKGKKGKGITLI